MVDNGSTDGTVEYLQGLEGATVVLHATNLGYTKGCNAGLAVTEPGEDVVLMNNDIVVTGLALRPAAGREPAGHQPVP
jgi:GT2 family glycosyltransferase